MRLHGQPMSAARIARVAGDLSAAGGVRAVVLDDGAERGVRALEFRTGSGLAFDVLVDRAMDIGPAEYRGASFGWRSATGFRHPGLHEYADEGGLSWLRSFSGLLVTAGLDHTLFTAEQDAAHFHYPHRRTTWNGLHGRVANIPARLLGYGERLDDDGETCVLWAEGEVRQAAVFGEHLRLRRRIEANLGGEEIRLIDTVTNAGFDRTPHMYLYHINIGWPFLDEGTRFEAPVDRTLWQSDSVAEQGVSNVVLPGPQQAFVEQVYEHELRPDAEGLVKVRLTNDRLGVYFEMAYRSEEFPAFFQWLHLREGAYAVGLEPSTNHVAGAPAAREDGSLVWLDAGESRSYHTTFAVGQVAARRDT
ncbi:aldose 1-epimerase family protein [Actinopolymorpha sp. B11F2]|uniref:aldose 1-epimerase family protein n=1 Tax=Actinopolymorpha sp. B11F2 TaxID=3160862 RepID=UPI0032E3F349